jgi:periplasmic protein TonB
VIQVSKRKRKDAKVCGEVSMFESIKQNDRPNTMKYFSSLLLSVMVHAIILCVIVTVPLIFCGTLNPGDLLIAMIAPPSLPEQISPPTALPYSATPGTGTRAGSGSRRAESVTATLSEPKKIPDGIIPAPPPDDPLVARIYGGGNGGGNGSGDGDGDGDGDGKPGSPWGIKGLASPAITEAPRIILKPPSHPKESKGTERVEIPSVLLASKLIYKVVPVYPPLALKTGVSGTVTLMAFIDEAGNVADLKVLSGHMLLKEAAMQAVKQWKYSPTVLNGEPVPVQATVNVIFTLNNK